jgi:hypothetical protein
MNKKTKKAEKPERIMKMPKDHLFGVIKDVTGTPGSGLANLNFTDGCSVLIESGFGLRQLAACFGAEQGAGDLNRKIRGQKIVYTLDDFGILAGFSHYADFKRDYGAYLRKKNKRRVGK